MRRLASRSIVAIIVIVMASAIGSPASAQSRNACDNAEGCVLVVSITGLIDPVIADYMSETVKSVGPDDGYLGIVFVLDSPGVVISDRALAAMVGTIVSSTAPVSIWVGPSGAEATGGAAELVAAVGHASMAPGTKIGDIGRQRLPLDRFGALFTGEATALRTTTISAERALKIGVVERVDPILGDHVLEIDGVKFDLRQDAQGRPKRAPRTTGITQALPLGSQLFHTVASPAVTYLLLAIGIGLLLFEFFTAGIGVAGVVGAAAAVFSAYGLAVLPARPWAVGLCLFAALAFGIDIQTAIPRFWTGVGFVAWTAGSLFLFDGMRAPWLALATGVVGMGVGMVSGMPSMVRSRFATPTIGRGWMVGMTGEAETDVDPEGTVRIDGATWRAITNRATPIAAGEPVRVAGIDGLTLEVEPPEGAAVDYREMRSSRTDTAREE